MKSEIYTIDRFEGNKAVLLLREDERQELVIERQTLPKQAKKGDILERHVEEQQSVYSILKDETQKKRKEMEKVLERLRKKNN